MSHPLLEFTGLKANNESQNNGTDILHQVAPKLIVQVYQIYKAPMPLSTHARSRGTRYWLQSR